MAHDYPKCQIIGIDVVPPSEKEGWSLIPIKHNNIIPLSAGQTQQKTNVQFQYGDILKSSLLFPDNYFDLVYQRDVATVLPFKLWPNLIREFYRITKPGGRIQLVEYGLFVTITK
jgi:SAM-dependent methyltransferase